MAQAALTLVLPFLVLLLDPVEAADRPTSSQIEAAEPLEGLRQFIERKDARIRQLEVELNRLREQCASANSESTFDTEIVAGQPQVAYSQADVCYRGCPFSDLGKAVLAASPGETHCAGPRDQRQLRRDRQAAALSRRKGDRRRPGPLGRRCMHGKSATRSKE